MYSDAFLELMGPPNMMRRRLAISAGTLWATNLRMYPQRSSACRVKCEELGVGGRGEAHEERPASNKRRGRDEGQN